MHVPPPPSIKGAVQRGRSIALLLLACLLAAVLWSWASGGIVGTLLDLERDSEEKLVELRAFFERRGALAPVLYALIVMVEVIVAPLPGTLLYLPGGAIFGGFLGGTLALIGNVAGAGVACQLVRSIRGRAATGSLFAREGLREYEEVLAQRGLWIVALLRVNPLTSSDLVSYAAGFTNMRVTSVMIGTLVGMAPLCYGQAYLAREIFTAFPWLVWPMAVACLVYLVVVIAIVRRLGRA